MKASHALTRILSGFLRALERRDEEQSAFQAQLLQEIGNLKRTSEANNLLLQEISKTIAHQDREVSHIREDFDAHIRDKVAHAR